MPVSSYIVRIRRSAGSSTLPPFPKPGCRAVKGPVPSSHSRCYVPTVYGGITANASRTKGNHHIRNLEESREGGDERGGTSQQSTPRYHVRMRRLTAAAISLALLLTACSGSNPSISTTLQPGLAPATTPSVAATAPNHIPTWVTVKYRQTPAEPASYPTTTVEA